MERPGWLFSLLAAAGLAVFATLAWLADGRPAFVEAASPLAALEARAIDGPAGGLIAHQPAVVLVWMPG